MKNTWIDWDKQWEQYAENFHDGLAHIDLQKYGASASLPLVLLPGPGFGDLSHPTTALALELMIPYAAQKTVLDIGCGSGILTLAAAMAGAEKVFGIDIDPEALRHAKKNARKNRLSKRAVFSEKLNFTKLPPECLILMNMIASEQKVVMQELQELKEIASVWVTSGILAEQKASYLELTESWGWKPILCKEQEGWLGFVFMAGGPYQRFLLRTSRE